MIFVSGTVLLMFAIIIYPNVLIFAEQIISHVNIINVQEIPAGGTAAFTISTGETFTITLPPGQEGTLTVQTTTVDEPTSGGLEILFLGEVLLLDVEPSDACIEACIISFTFDDSHLAAAGISDPSEVSIFQDSELDGTFVVLQTLLTDDVPSPYTVTAFITTTSFFGLGTIDSELFCGKTLQRWQEEGANIIFGSEKDDRLEGIDGIDIIFGLAGDDRIIGNDGDDCLMGGDGMDRIIGEGGNDIIFGGDGSDRLHGGGGNDLIDGGDSNDRISGNRGNDLINGGDGEDDCNGGSGESIVTNCEPRVRNK